MKDLSQVAGLKKLTEFYDDPTTDIIISKETKNKISSDPNINDYNRKAFQYNTYLPMPLIYFNSDDGLVLKFGIDWTTHGFRKERFKTKYGFDVRWGTQGSVSLSGKISWAEVLGKWDFSLSGIYADVLKSPVVAYPLRALDCCLMSVGAACAIICDEDTAMKLTKTNYL